MAKSIGDLYEESTRRWMGDEVSDGERREAKERELIRGAIDETETEIFNDALGYPADDNDGDDTLEWPDSIDGEPLSMEEIAEGVNENGYDRPLALARDENLIDENAILRQERQQLARRLDEIENGPERRAARDEMLREALYNQYGVLPTDHRGDQLIRDLESAATQHQVLSEDRVNRSLQSARDEYGEEFDTAYRSLISMDRNNAAARAIVNDIWNSPDPGERMMHLAGQSGSVIGGLGRGGRDMGALGLAGSRNQVGGGRSRGGGRRSADIADADGGFGRADVEQDIFDSAFQD